MLLSANTIKSVLLRKNLNVKHVNYDYGVIIMIKEIVD